MKLLKKLFRRKKKKSKSRYPTYKSAPTLESKGGSRKSSGERPRRKKKVKRYRVKPMIKKIVGSVAGLGAAFVILLYLTLPNINELNKVSKTPSIVIKTEAGDIIGSFGDVYGEFVPYAAFPKSLIDAVVATEDRNFYHHFGIDPLGLLRATFANIRARHVVQGGSTITQQVAKNVFLTPERSLIRKLKEAMLAFKLEMRYSKEDILSIYLNRVYLGAGTYGVDAAARRYFGKPAHELTLSESAIMAGLLKAPSRFAPTSNPAAAKKRADQVLLNMQDAGYLTDAQTTKARAELTKSMDRRKKNARSIMYFSDWIADQVSQYIGDNITDDIVVTTTLKPDWQLAAEKAISEVMDKNAEKLEASQAALVSMTPDGAIRAMVGGRDYSESQYNRATQALRQPGSSFKLFVYLAGLEGGLTPSSIVEDQPISVQLYRGKWSPKNYTGQYLGAIPLKEAVTQSINTVAVQVSQQVGVDKVVDMARRLGITSELDPVPSIALGATEASLLEMTNAYAHLASGGIIVYPYGIVDIKTSKGELLYRRLPAAEGRAISRNTAGMMNEMLQSVVENGTGRAAKIGRPVGGKTGTTSDYKDAWFMGFTADLVTGVWVGNDNNEPMKKVTGGMLPAQIWHGYMATATASQPVRDLPSGGFFESLAPDKPWQEEQAPQEEEKPRKRDVELGKSFWDKLLR